MRYCNMEEALEVLDQIHDDPDFTDFDAGRVAALKKSAEDLLDQMAAVLSEHLSICVGPSECQEGFGGLRFAFWPGEGSELPEEMQDIDPGGAD